MKTILFSALLTSLVSTAVLAQDVTTVNATSTEISDNLDLRAVASVFGDAANLEDFERKLNDPDLQISNLDLNNDNQVDYLRVIESVEGNTHLIIIQSVLARDVYQDVATVEVERDSRNNVQVQVVGDVYMYGPNYIYEPVYVHHPVIYTSFWVGNYRPYCSAWYWGYYPSYYYAWNPYPVFRYRRNVHVHINIHNHYNYVNVRRSDRAVALYNGRRSNAYERQYPNRSFQQRHSNVANRYELDQTRKVKDVGVRNGLAANTPRNSGTRNNPNTRTEATAIRNNNSIRSNGNVRTENNTPRGNSSIRNESNTPRANSSIRTRDNQNANTPRENTSIRTRDNQTIRTESTPRENTAVRTRDNQSFGTPRENNSVRTRDNQSVRTQSTPRENSVRAQSASQPRAEAQPNRAKVMETAPRQPRMESVPRQNSTPRMESRGNSGRREMGAERQSQGGRNSDGRR